MNPFLVFLLCAIGYIVMIWVVHFILCLTLGPPKNAGEARINGDSFQTLAILWPLLPIYILASPFLARLSGRISTHTERVGFGLRRFVISFFRKEADK